MDTSNVINLGIFFATVIGAGITWRGVFAARAAADRANQISERLLGNDDERRREEIAANLEASFELRLNWAEAFGPRPRQITIRNTGNGTAYHVQLFYNDMNVRYIDSLNSRFFPENIEAGRKTFVREATLGAIKQPARVRITWENSVGYPKALEKVLSFDPDADMP
jgi:hypothetical protein